MSEEFRGNAMYHGSRTRIDGGWLEPRPSRVVDNEAKVFGTPSSAFALQYVGRHWTDRDMESGTIDGQMYMIEKWPGVFAKTFRGRTGYLYQVDPTDFHRDRRLPEAEWVSDVPVKILRIAFVEDAEKALLRSKIKIFFFEDLNIITFVKRGEFDVDMTEEVFDAESLQGLQKLKKRLTRVKVGKVDYEDINRHLWGKTGVITKFRTVAVPRRDQRFFATW